MRKASLLMIGFCFSRGEESEHQNINLRFPKFTPVEVGAEVSGGNPNWKRFLTCVGYRPLQRHRWGSSFFLFLPLSSMYFIFFH